MGFVQHERTMSRRETYEYCAERTGFKAAAVRAVFMALAEFIRANQRKGNITYLDGIASIRNYVKGLFAGLAVPWVKGVNYLSVQAVEMEPFRSLIAAILPVNNSEGAKPAINTVLDEVTLVYDVITGTDVFRVAGFNMVLAKDGMGDDVEAMVSTDPDVPVSETGFALNIDEGTSLTDGEEYTFEFEMVDADGQPVTVTKTARWRAS
ncbi:MAG: hypothetical protein IJ658_04380 [Kiritimatiellae bacterium]|nr:hypothetical protein [Kiritimatiellia bacterium]